MFKNILLISAKPKNYIPLQYENIFYFPESLGDFNSTSNYSFPSTLDGNPVVLTYDNFTVNSGHTVTVSQRCKGLYLYIKGDLTVNGTLSMTARGAKAQGKYVVTNYKANKKYVAFLNQNFDVNKILENFDKNQVIYPTGGVGSTTASNPGVNGACGAGGFTLFNSTRRSGGSGTSFSGGTGAGGGYSYNGAYLYGDNGESNGGAGGKSLCRNGGSTDGGQFGVGGTGAGNPSGRLYYSNTLVTLATKYVTAAYGQNGTGGLLILIVDGNINISGSIVSNGSNGGRGGRWYNSDYACGGAGSGGGAIHIFYIDNINIKSSKIKVSGGTGGLGVENVNFSSLGDNYTGKTGGAGTVNCVYRGKSEETLVGKWINGDNIYRFITTINKSNIEITTKCMYDISFLDINQLVKFTGSMFANNNCYPLCASLSRSWLEPTISGSQTFTIGPDTNRFSITGDLTFELLYTKNKPSNDIYNGTNIFSLEEDVPMGTWINGKTLYRRVYTVPAISAINSFVDVSISDLNLERVINLYGTFRRSDNVFMTTNLNNYSRSITNEGVIRIMVQNSSWITTVSRYIILEYIKVED